MIGNCVRGTYYPTICYTLIWSINNTVHPSTELLGIQLVLQFVHKIYHKLLAL